MLDSIQHPQQMKFLSVEPGVGRQSHAGGDGFRLFKMRDDPEELFG